MSLLTHHSAIGLWQEVVHEATSQCAIKLEKDLEYYLVDVLIRHTNKPEMAKQVFALAMLEASQQPQNSHLLQSIGDQCLIFSGLFPANAEKRLVNVSYFVNLGRAAYANISRKANDLYDVLARQFVILMDVLQSIRPHHQMTPIQIYDQWQELSSQRAYRLLQARSQALPVITFKQYK